MALFRFDPDLSMPRYLSGLPVLDGLDELESYYRAEMASWLVLDERRASRAALLEMGISCTMIRSRSARVTATPRPSSFL